MDLNLKNLNLKIFLLGVLIVATGLFMVITPKSCLNITVIIVGLSAVASGIYNLAVMYKASDDEKYKKTILIKSCVSIGIGLVAVVFPFLLRKSVTGIWHAIDIVLAIYLVIYSFVNFLSASKITDAETKKKVTAEGLFCLLIAVILFIINPEEVMEVIVRIAGIISIIVGFTICIIQVLSKKEIVPAGDDTVVIEDAIVKDDDTQE